MALDQDYTIELRTTGSDNNGGGFYNRDDGTSVDYSQQDAAQLNPTDLACTTGGATLTSATGGFTAAMVGNLIQITAGTNFTAGFYEITGHTDTNTVTLDRDPTDGSNGSSGTGYVGGALATPGKVGGLIAALTGSFAHVYQATGTYILSSGSANVAGGKVDLPDGPCVTWVGYTAGSARTTGESGWLAAKPEVNCGSQGSLTVFDCTGLYYARDHTFINIKVDANSQSSIYGFESDGGAECHWVWCETVDCGCGFKYGAAIGCKATGGTYGFYGATGYLSQASGCTIGFRYGIFMCCLAYKCDGTSGFGVSTCSGCVSVDNDGDGFSTSGNLCYGCIAAYNGGRGFDGHASNISSIIHCATIGNTSGAYNTGDAIVVTGLSELSADPFVDRANDDYRLNNVDGGGKDLRGQAGGVPPCHIDLGAAGQHKDPGFVAASVGRFGVMES